jgi:hypothetical protein
VSPPSSPADCSYGGRRRRGSRRRFDSGRGLEAPVRYCEFNGGLRRSWDGVERVHGGEGIDGGAPVELEAGGPNASIAAAIYHYGGGGVG